MIYRAEIDGLRALAVLSVIFFHAGFDSFSGGFLGVDIFFVISGYLITSIIYNEIESNKFSLYRFYVRRTRRILPALFFMLAATYVASWYMHIPSENRVVGLYVIASIFSVSNVLLYLRGDDYFGLEEGSNPLFHTWSLGVEEQFYIIFPLLLMFVMRRSSLKLLYVLIGLFLASLLLAEVISRIDQNLNFYLILTRAWELVAGACLSILSKKSIKPSETLSLIGLIVVAISMFFFDSQVPSPSLYTLFPILGVSLLILFSDKTNFVGKFLSLKILVGVGLVSYSAYLWHMPLYTFIKDFNLVELEFITIYFISLIFTSYLSYRLIEVPFRRKISLSGVVVFLFLLGAPLTYMGFTGYDNEGFPNRTPLISSLKTNNGYGIECNGNHSITSECSSATAPKIAVIGNSFSMMYVNALDEIHADYGVAQLTIDSCPLQLASLSGASNKQCEEFYRKAFDTVFNESSIDSVFVSSPFITELSDLNNILLFENFLKALYGKKVYILGPPPFAPRPIGKCLLKNSLTGSDTKCNFAVTDGHKNKLVKLTEVAEKMSHVNLLDVTNSICDNDYCYVLESDFNSIYVDTGHLTNFGASKVIKELSQSYSL